MVKHKPMIGLGIAALLALPVAPALAASGGPSAPHTAHPVAGAQGHGGHRGGRTETAPAAHGTHLRQFEGTVISFDGTDLAVKLQGSRGVTVTVGLSATATRITEAGVMTTTAALASGEQVHVAATASGATSGGTTAYTAVRVAIQRRAAETAADADGAEARPSAAGKYGTHGT